MKTARRRARTSKAVSAGSVITRAVKLGVLHSFSYLILSKAYKRDAAVPIFADGQRLSSRQILNTAELEFHRNLPRRVPHHGSSTGAGGAAPGPQQPPPRSAQGSGHTATRGCATGQ